MTVDRTAALDWKEDVSREVALTLYDVEIDADTTLYLVEGNPLGTGDVEWPKGSGTLYKAAAIRAQIAKKTIEGELPELQIEVSNIDRVAGGYIEQYDLEGNTVTIRIVRLRDDAILSEETHQIRRCAFNSFRALFTLGTANLFERRIPWRTYTRLRCQNLYQNRFTEGNGCGYPSDLFSQGTQQNIAAAATVAEKERQFGWFALNADAANAFDVDRTIPNTLLISTVDPSVNWDSGAQLAPFLYKKLVGDFDVFTRIDTIETRPGTFAAILCQDGTPALSWCLAGLAEGEDGASLSKVSSAQLGVDDVEVTAENDDPRHDYIRMRRVGNVFTLFSSAEFDANWTQVDERTVPMAADVRIGLVLADPGLEEGEISAAFHFFQFRAGGLPTCDLTIDGKDGCAVHKNTHRFFAFPAIPER